MAVDKKGRTLPKGIQQRYSEYEGRFMHHGTRYMVHGRTIGETQKAMTDLKYKLEHGLYIEKNKITLESWFNTWINEYKANSVKMGTIANYNQYFKTMIQPRIGNVLLEDVRGEHIQKLYNDLTKEGYAASSIKCASAVLSGCLKQAVKNGLIERNPAKLAEIPKQVKKRERIAMTKEQQKLFMEYARESYLYNFFAVMLRTGMRCGEIRGLKFSDIDKKKGVIKVQRTLRHINGKGYIEDTPKTKTSLRDIPLTDDTLKYLEAQKKLLGFRVERMDRYIFCTERGKPLCPERVQLEIDRIVKKIRADGNEFPHITSHVFRHTFATRAIEAGMQPQVLKTILGHSTLSMTMDLYSHVMPETRSMEMEKLVGAF